MLPINSAQDLGKLIKQTRKDLKLTQAGLSGLSRHSNRTINWAENGNPTIYLETALTLLRELGIQLYAMTPGEWAPVVIEALQQGRVRAR